MSPRVGTGMSTEYTISALNFLDEDVPLTYRFVYYKNSNSYYEDIESGFNHISA